MKKALLLTLFVAMAAGVFAQTQRMVLLEHFTQASCGPCATQNPLVKQYFDNSSTNATSIKYQTSWPGTDPMNSHNPTEIAARVSYYGVTGVPNAFIDGYVEPVDDDNLPGNLFPGGQSTKMDNRAMITSPFDITIVHELNSAGTGVDVTAVITATNAVAVADLVAHVAIVEKHISFASAPGSNGETDFYNVMKKMLPNSNGTALQDVWTNGTVEVVQESWNFSNVYNIGDLAVVVFIQDNATKEVYQAGFKEMDIPANINDADLSATASHTSSGYCDNTYSPVVTVKNNSTSNLDSIEVAYTLNGAPYGPLMIALNAGASQAVTFPDITVAFGDEVLFYSSIQDYGYLDLSATNNNVLIDNFVVLHPTFDNGTGLDVAFDGTPVFAPNVAGAIDDNPDDISAFYIDNSGINGLTWNLGGHGNSNGCFMWDFYTIGSGNKSSLIFEEIDLSGTYNNMLSFTYAYAQYSAENDKLTISASNDCGATWVELFNEQGTDLATRAAVGNNTRFFPADATITDEWESKTVVMSMFDGQSDIIVKVEGTSDFGNALYVDDIKTSSFLVSTGNTELESSLNVYPNPAVDNFNVNFEINETTDLSITLVNAIGQTIRTISNETFTAGEHNINVATADLAAGTYFVKIRNDVGVITKTVTVTK